MTGRYPLLAAVTFILLAAALTSCGSTNPNTGRVLLSITVTPTAADAKNSPTGQVVFTATGTFNLPPLTGPLTFAPPYAGQFVVDNPPGSTIATVVASGPSQVTVQCAAGAAGTVDVVAAASANNGTSTIVNGNGQLTCP